MAVASTLAGRAFYKRSTESTGTSLLNRRTDSFIGRTVTLASDIENGVGSVNIDRTRWRAVGPDTPAGSKVMITALDGSSLVVEPVDQS